jgi:hypothetical protein
VAKFVFNYYLTGVAFNPKFPEYLIVIEDNFFSYLLKFNY